MSASSEVALTSFPIEDLRRTPRPPRDPVGIGNVNSRNYAFLVPLQRESLHRLRSQFACPAAAGELGNEIKMKISHSHTNRSRSVTLLPPDVCGFGFAKNDRFTDDRCCNVHTHFFCFFQQSFYRFVPGVKRYFESSPMNRHQKPSL